MIVSREMDYSVRILRALHRQEGCTSQQIMEREHLAQPVTYKLLRRLTQAGFVQGRRGKIGGYRLLRDCAQITLYDLFTAVESPLYLTECLETGYRCDNNLCGECGVHREFARIQKALEAELKKTALSQLF